MGPVSLGDVPAGSFCVVDTNVLLCAEQGVSEQAQGFLRRLSSRDLRVVAPQTVWQELTHKLMLMEAMMQGIISGGNPARALAERPDGIRSLSLYREKIRALVDMGLGFEPCRRDDLVETAFRLQGSYGLLTNDAVVLAVTLRLNADALVSADRAFFDVREVPVYAPTDIERQ